MGGRTKGIYPSVLVVGSWMVIVIRQNGVADVAPRRSCARMIIMMMVISMDGIDGSQGWF